MVNRDRAKQPPIVPKKYAGRWIAWDRAQTRIVASGRTFEGAREAARKAGERDPLLAKVPRADVRFVGAGARSFRTSAIASTHRPRSPAPLLYRLEVPIRVIGASGDAFLSALVDTGADETLLPQEIAEAIGAKLDTNRPMRAAGIGCESPPPR